MRTTQVRIASLALAVASLAEPSLAQEQAAYRTQSDTAWYRLHNPFHLYWVGTAGDTIGTRTANAAVERHVWLPDPDLRVEVTQLRVGLTRRTEVDTIALRSDGRVIPTADPDDMERIDFVMPLPRPSVELDVGTEWTDTVIQEAEDASGPNWYRVNRRLRVERMVDSLGTRLADVSSTGHIEFGGSWWIDSIAGTKRWMDTEGETTETFLFDVMRGRFVARSWSMHLRGTGGMPNDSGGVDTVAAGLISGETLTMIEAAEAALHARALPEGDTSFTIRGPGVMMMHTLAREGLDRLQSSMSRVDGMVGTADVRYEYGTPASVSVLWTSFENEPREWYATTRDDRIDVRNADPQPVPDWSDTWAIADYGMEELLAPALLSLPADQQPWILAVYRPFADKWDEAEVVVAERHDAVIAVVRYVDDPTTWYFIYNQDGDLLFLEHDGVEGVTQRVPAPGSPLRAEMEATLGRLLAQPQGVTRKTGSMRPRPGRVPAQRGALGPLPPGRHEIVLEAGGRILAVDTIRSYAGHHTQELIELD